MRKVSECYLYTNDDRSVDIFLRFEGDDKSYTLRADYGGSLFIQELEPLSKEMLDRLVERSNPSKEELEEDNNF